jgi:hypothetical protein
VDLDVAGSIPVTRPIFPYQPLNGCRQMQRLRAL